MLWFNETFSYKIQRCACDPFKLPDISDQLECLRIAFDKSRQNGGTDTPAPKRRKVEQKREPYKDGEVDDEFECPYDMSKALLNPLDLAEYLLSVRHMYSTPIITMTQTSGTGKTRLVRELARFYPVLYGSPISRFHMFVRMCEGHGSFILPWILGAMEWRKSNLDASLDDFWHAQVAGEILDKISCDKKKKKEPWGSFFQSWGLDASMPWVLVIDDAGELAEEVSWETSLSVFMSVRQDVINRSAITCDVVVLALDSTNAVNHFLESLVNNSMFPPPIWAISDSFSHDQTINLVKALTKEHWISLGRPLWKAVYDSPKANQQGALRHLIGVAESKLRGGHPDSLVLESSVAAVACITGFKITPGHPICVKLVRHHLALLMVLTEARRTYSIRYPSEPVLAAAAANLCFNGSHNSIDVSCVRHLQTAVGLGVVQDRDIGSLVGVWVLVRAQHRADSPLTPLSLNEFFGSLLGCALETVGPLNGLVMFNHALVAQSDVVDMKSLEVALRHHSMIRTPNGHMVIPYSFDDRDSSKLSIGALFCTVVVGNRPPPLEQRPEFVRWADELLSSCGKLPLATQSPSVHDGLRSAWDLLQTCIVDLSAGWHSVVVLHFGLEAGDELHRFTDTEAIIVVNPLQVWCPADGDLSEQIHKLLASTHTDDQKLIKSTRHPTELEKFRDLACKASMLSESTLSADT